MDVEAAYLAALTAVASFETDGTSLRLLDVDGTVTLAFEAGPTTVAGSWIVTSIGDGEGAVSSLSPGSQLTAVFATDGTVSGSSGCNEYRGTYVVSGNTIAIDALISTKRACISGGLGDQESAFIGALRSATSFTLNGSLQLLAANGALLVSFSPAAGLPD
jgi:heat shock protein HslJ